MAFEKVKEIIKEAPAFTQLTDLAAERLGGKVLYATDDFFAEKEKISHVGILIGDGRIIHASEQVRIDKINEQGIYNRDIEAYTLKVKSIRRFV